MSDLVDTLFNSDLADKFIKGNRTPEERWKVQLNLPVCYDFADNKVILQNYINSFEIADYILFPELCIDKKAEITIDRINAQYKYDIMAHNGSEIVRLNKTSAVNEVWRRTELGMDLINLEGLTILLVLKRLE